MTPAAGEDGDGVLGNLPRSRPGHRSERRTAPGSGPRKAASERSTGSRPAKPRSDRGGERAANAGRAAAPEPDSARRAAPTRPVGAGGGGPLGEAARVAGRAARLGLDVAGGVLKRLPRP